MRSNSASSFGEKSLLPTLPAPKNRVQAVLALLRGEPYAAIHERYRISRSALYQYRQRALVALREALAEHRRGPHRPHNRLSPARERQVAELCHDRPTWSSYKVWRYLGPDAPSPRTVQRVRQRQHLDRLPKRAPPVMPAHRLDPVTRARAQALVRDKPWLGPERAAWDLQNSQHLTVSPSTLGRLKRQNLKARLSPPAPKPAWRFYERHHPHSLWHGDFLEKITLTDSRQTAYQLTLLDDYSRGYVFCDLFLNPDTRTTIRALIAAMRQWRIIPTAVIFDNGAAFKGKLLSAFCRQVGFRLIHTAVYHPQTNGKLERAFRDDMRDFYQRYETWLLDPLRRDLPAYMAYRNHVRGHHALGGQPAITRLREQTWMALPAVLETLESCARYELGRKTIPPTGCIRLFGRDAFLGEALAKLEITFCESLEGLEAWHNGQCKAVLRDYRTFTHLLAYRTQLLPSVFYFEPCRPSLSP